MQDADGQHLDQEFRAAHDAVFAVTDCLQCANCCKTSSPIIEQKDIDRISEALGISRSEVVKQYLVMDEDGDFVFPVQPCPMLLNDNRCKIYDHRPEACRDYPHTRRKGMKDLLKLTKKNLEICPAVAEILTQIKIP